MMKKSRQYIHQLLLLLCLRQLYKYGPVSLERHIIEQRRTGFQDALYSTQTGGVQFDTSPFGIGRWLSLLWYDSITNPANSMKCYYSGTSE